MAKLEAGRGRLVSVDTTARILHFREVRRVAYSGQPPAKEWEHSFGLESAGVDFSATVGKEVEYVLSDDVVVDLTLAS